MGSWTWEAERWIWSMVAEASVHGDFALLLWACGEDDIMRRTWGREAAHCTAARSRGTGREESPWSPFRVALVMKVSP